MQRRRVLAVIQDSTFTQTGSVEPFHSGDDPVSFVSTQLANGEALIVAGRHPHLAAQRRYRFSGEIATHLIVSHHDMGEAVGTIPVEASLGAT